MGSIRGFNTVYAEADEELECVIRIALEVRRAFPQPLAEQSGDLLR